MIDGRIPLWMRNVISLCHAKGGRITSEEIACIAAVANRYDAGPTLVMALRRSKNIFIEVIGEQAGQGHRRMKVYRVTRREVSATADVGQKVAAIR